MSKVLDGATTSLNRQMSMLRHIRANNSRGLRFSEIDFYMTVNHGVSDKWVQKYLNKYSKWGVITQKGTKMYVDEEKWAEIQDARDKEFTLGEP